MLIGRTAGAAAHLVQTLRQTLGLMHFEVQQHGFCIGRLTIDQLIAGRMLAFRGPILNEAAGGNMRRGLANVGAYADAINRHGSKLSTAEKLKSPEITISILDCLGVRRSGYGGRLALVNMEPDWPAYGSQHAYMDFTDAPHASVDPFPGMYALHEEAVCRRRSSGTVAWNWNVGVISPPLSPAGSHCR